MKPIHELIDRINYLEVQEYLTEAESDELDHCKLEMKLYIADDENCGLAAERDWLRDRNTELLAATTPR